MWSFRRRPARAPHSKCISGAARSRCPRIGARAQPIGGTETVLFVEDDPAVASFGLACLRRLGYDVTPAMNGSEAVALAASRSEPFDLLLTDVVIPGMSGSELAAVVHRHHPTHGHHVCLGLQRRARRFARHGPAGAAAREAVLAGAAGLRRADRPRRSPQITGVVVAADPPTPGPTVRCVPDCPTYL